MALTNQQRFKIVCDFEKKYHGALWDFMAHKMANRDDDPKIPVTTKPIFRPSYARVKNEPNCLDKITHGGYDLTDLEILDFSEDSCVFTELFCERYKVKHISCIVTDSNKHTYECADNMSVHEMNLKHPAEYNKLLNLGRKFDLIVLKDVMYQVSHLDLFFDDLCKILKPDGLIFATWRPSAPILPIPNTAIPTWRTVTGPHDPICEAAQGAGLKIDAYAANCPVQISRQNWKEVLLSRCLPCISQCPNCTPQVIEDFISKKPEKMKFDELIYLLVFWFPVE